MLGHKTHQNIFISKNLSRLYILSETKNQGIKAAAIFFLWPGLYFFMKKYPKVYLHTHMGRYQLS